MANEPPNGSYLKTQIMTASPAQLRLMLLDGAIRFAEQARDAIAKQELEAAFDGLSRTRDIIAELINGLQPEHDAELCAKLASLYTYLYSRLIEAGSTRAIEPVEEVLQLLRYERDTWSMLLEKLARENSAASRLDKTPTALPSADASPAGDSPLIGGSVSVQG